MNPPLQTDWDTEYRTLDDYELDTDGTPVYVKKILNPSPFVFDDPPPKIVDDGARLDTYQARRLRTIQDLTEDLEQALVRANQAKDGAASIGYFPIFLAKMDEMIAAGNEARDLIAMFEEDRG